MSETRIHVKASREYDVVIGTGLISRAGSLMKEAVPKATKILIVSETNVAPLYLDTVRESLTGEGFECVEYVFEAGEQSKNIDTVAGMWGVMAKAGFTRTDAAVALGGGVTGDMAGFAAATFLRGIQVVQIPTSLLAQVDASVGGKTGIDLPEGKNQVGAFHQPSMVIEDIECLGTLSEDKFTEGLGEVLKYAFIMDTELYGMLSEYMAEGKAANLQHDREMLIRTVTKCVEDKVDVITGDEFDTGRRQILNFGHTIGHVIERNSGFTKDHGVCVAMGMGIMTGRSLAAGLMDQDTHDKIISLIKGYGLPVTDDITPEDAVSGAMNDKKKRGNTISLILVNRIGEAEIVPMTPEQMLEFLTRG
ncbi:3-dehydroquinate synthase [Ruminococcaceae bacterium YRB3002]|nr:3-dehydroquinate synthase [Ruminococcaceae bacterium YRB3002]